MTLPKITKKQQEITGHLLQFKYLHTIQIQTLLHHKDKKTINNWLKDLTKNDYTVRIYDPKKFGENTKPAIYYLGSNGIRWAKRQAGFDRSELPTLYRLKKRSREHINHCLFLADIYLDLRKHTAENGSLTFYTRHDYTNENSPFVFLREISPDVCFIKQKNQKNKGKKHHYLLHNIPESMLRFRSHKLRRKIREYIEFYNNSE